MMMRSNLVPRHESNRRRAAVAVLTAITLVVLLSFASLAVDLGFVRAVCGDMQHTADAGALAGASALMQSDGEDIDSANDRAVDVIERMLKSQGVDALDDQIIEVGTWDFNSREFTAASETTKKSFAVRVVGVRNKTPLFFAAIMGKYSTDVTREAVALASGPCGGIWGLEGVRAGSINTDSYDSTAGSYSVDTAGENGDICSGRDITTGGSFNIHGDVMPGFGFGLTVNGSSGEITGYTTSHRGGLPSVPVDLEDAKYTNDNGSIALTAQGKSPYRSPGHMALQSGDNLTLAGGTYYFESIRLTGGATLTVAGPTTIYVAGAVDCTGGGIVNQTQSPHDLTIKSAGPTFRLGGGSAFYGTLLAPSADVVLGANANFYGMVIGRILELKGDTTIHVDESLPDYESIGAPMPSLVK